MARLPKEEEQRWRYRIGSTRPQNIKRIVDNFDKGAYSAGQIVSPDEQKAKLEETTIRIEEDLENLDIIIENLADKPQENSARLEKLYKLKNEFYKNLVAMWSISETITGGSKGPSSISGDKVQVNFANIDYKKLHQDAKKALRDYDEERREG